MIKLKSPSLASLVCLCRFRKANFRDFPQVHVRIVSVEIVPMSSSVWNLGSPKEL